MFGGVVFTNMDAPESSGYRHGNTIKIERDPFIAHGVERESALATRDAIERRLIRVAVKLNQQLANVKQVVSATWVAEYQR